MGSTSRSPSRRSNTQATAYAVDATTMALTGFHFTHGFAGGAVRLSRNSYPMTVGYPKEKKKTLVELEVIFVDTIIKRRICNRAIAI
jgi:hypothetical protein